MFHLLLDIGKKHKQLKEEGFYEAVQYAVMGLVIGVFVLGVGALVIHIAKKLIVGGWHG